MKKIIATLAAALLPFAASAQVQNTVIMCDNAAGSKQFMDKHGERPFMLGTMRIMITKDQPVDGMLLISKSAEGGYTLFFTPFNKDLVCLVGVGTDLQSADGVGLAERGPLM